MMKWSVRVGLGLLLDGVVYRPLADFSNPSPHLPKHKNRDTRGITSSNYLREEIRGILEGVFPEKGLDIEGADDGQVAALAVAGRATRAFRRWVIGVVGDLG